MHASVGAELERPALRDAITHHLAIPPLAVNPRERV